ncbi:hypothetical protein PRZ48_006156 [Zasmidium cellare]|uniref:Rhodopsin domain-containing protein n=1 Tax=Zasmidium cellare TaxID=395010 RepID=A0ABR0EMN3_ZASCE|nr:hypothetical protein PRZ48_006156 [Zasmidium cellare]
MFAFATFFTLCRFLSRSPLFSGTGYGWDDWTLLFCYILLVPTDVSAETEVQNGLGLDVFMVPTANIVEILRWFYVGEILYNIIVMVTKISILLLYLRIWTADSTTYRFRTSCWILIALLTATTLTGIFTIIFQCSPVSYAWLQATGKAQGHCIQLTPFTYVYAALDITFDFIIFLLPIHNLLSLTIPLWKKLGVILVFLCGFFVTACSIIRLQYLVRLGDTTNLTWDFQYIGMWSLVECNFSVVCVCMPAMAGLVQRLWSGTFRVRTVVVTKGGRDRLVEEIEGNLKGGGSPGSGGGVEKGVAYGSSGQRADEGST